ncbi:FHA domain-containing protein [Terracoccus sp. 273MFTsu3.1]|uniref:FHA domain-containing protein n=1 Tax=Terracoccus sp. 273MFTsu3.1 TaxID=1172188 RepID=UPI00038253FE|nr:FHA domain-containing protein [Terracoccus sp. 273MFTsu3.1]
MSAVCPNGHTSEAEDYCDTCGSPIDASAQPAAGGGVGASADPTGGPAQAANGAGTSGSSLDLDPPAAAAPATPAPADPAAPAGLVCPNCQTENPDGALFCEACGYDFTTGAMPRDPSAGPDDLEDTAPDGEAVDPAAAGSAGAPAVTGAGAGAGAGEEQASTSFEWLAEVWVDPDWYQTQEAEDPCPSPGLPTIMPLRHRSVLLGRVSTSKNTNPEIDLSSDPGVSRRHAQLTTDGSRWFVEDLGSSNGTFVGPASGPLPLRSIAVGPKTELGDDDRLYVGAWTRVVVRRATPDEVEAYA